MIIAPETIDNFRSRPQGWVAKKCAFTDCKYIGTVILYHTPKNSGVQQQDQICGKHALQLANNVLNQMRAGCLKSS